MDYDYARINSWRFRWGVSHPFGHIRRNGIERSVRYWIEGFILGSIAGFVAFELISWLK
jgi:hypothetical protein